MNKKPLVTIAITCYNYADYVSEAIESALGQTYQNLEVIVLDDGSTDNSLDVINKYAARVRIVTRKNKGVVYTRNEALKLAKGDFFFFLDADDFFDKDYVENMLAVAEEFDADVVYPNWRVFGDDEYKKRFDEFATQLLIEQQIHCTSESLIRLNAIKGHKFESEKVAEDWDFFLGLALAGKKFKLATDCYINYRVRKNTRGSTRSYWDDMRIFIGILQKWQVKYPNLVDPADLPIFAGKSRDDYIGELNRIITEKDEAIDHLKGVIDEYKRVKVQLTQELAESEARYNNLINSKSYKIGDISAKPVRLVKSLTHSVKEITHSRYKKRQDKNIDASYLGQMEPIDAKSKKIAVVVHLFYVENWPLFLRKLNLLPQDKFDLYVTMPDQNRYFVHTIKESFPSVRVVFSPNRGRDVLPFLKILKIILAERYAAILKFHSKKSTHWSGGQDWLETMLDEIIPEDKGTLTRIIKLAEEGDFGIIGPKSVYYPLSVNYPANSAHITKVLTDIYGDERASSVVSLRSEYGFFGGTMFWIGTESLRKIARYDSAEFFEEESGQIDGTFAHAVERLLSIMPQIEGVPMYEVDGKRVSGRKSRTDNIPEWSEDHDK